VQIRVSWCREPKEARSWAGTWGRDGSEGMMFHHEEHQVQRVDNLRIRLVSERTFANREHGEACAREIAVDGAPI